jgi:anti-anti-sigma regulatory factor
MMEVVKTARGLEVKIPPLLRGMSSREYFQEIETGVKETASDLYFDCSSATLIDSTALGKIIFIAKELQRNKRRVVFESCPPAIKDFLARLKVDKIIEIA